MSNATATSPQPPRRFRMEWLIIGLAILLGSGLGFYLYYSAVASAEGVTETRKRIREFGKTADGEACVNEVIRWLHEDCDAAGQMCLDAVSSLVGDCLIEQDRSELCERIDNTEKSSKWAYHKCKEESGVDKDSKRAVRESCTEAWRALDTFCKTDQAGVPL